MLLMRMYVYLAAFILPLLSLFAAEAAHSVDTPYWAEQKRLAAAAEKTRPANVHADKAFNCYQGLNGETIETEVSYDQFIHPNPQEAILNKIIADMAGKSVSLQKNRCGNIKNSSEDESINSELWTIRSLCNGVVEVINENDYASGAHPTSAVSAYFFDRATGKKLLLENFFTPSGMVEFDKLARNKLNAERCEVDFNSVRTQGAVDFILPDDLIVKFSDMEIMGHACGAPNVPLAMKEVKPLLDPEGPLGCAAR